MTSKERFFTLLKKERADRPAVINPVSVVTTESLSALRLDFSKVHLSADNTAALACYSYEMLGFDSIMPYFSVVAEAAALGATIHWGNNQNMPAQRNQLFSEPGQIGVPDGYLLHPGTRSIIDAIKIISARFGSEALILGKAMGPWSLCLRFYGMENTLIDTIENAKKLSEMLNALCSFTSCFTEAQLSAGADMVTIADHATRNLIGPKVYDEFVKPLHRKLNNMFPGKLILHCCGSTEDRVSLFAEAGFPLYHFESANNPMIMLQLAGDMKLTGCVDNPTVLLKGSTEDVARQAGSILMTGIDILSPECAVPLSVPNNNLTAIVDCARAFCYGDHFLKT